MPNKNKPRKGQRYLGNTFNVCSCNTDDDAGSIIIPLAKEHQATTCSTDQINATCDTGSTQQSVGKPAAVCNANFNNIAQHSTIVVSRTSHVPRYKQTLVG
jgi:hypothetical protein